LAVSVGFPICQNWLAYSIYPHRLIVATLKYLSPDTSFSLVTDAEFRTAKNSFWWTVGLVHAGCWFFLAAASFIVPRSWQDNPPGAERQRWRDRWHRWSYGDAEERFAFRKRLLDINAFFWLAARARLKPAHVWSALILIACLWTWGAMEQGREWLNSWV